MPHCTAFPPSIRRRASPLPPRSSPARPPLLPRQRIRPRGQHRPHRRNEFEMRNTRPRFRRGSCPAPPVSTQRARHCLAACSPDFRRLLLARHSRTTAFETRGRPSLAPVTTPAAAALPRLVMNVPQSVTLLAGVTLRTHTVCLGLPPEHSFYRFGNFSRTKLEAPGYPSVCGFRDSAPSPIEVTDKPLRAFRG